MTKKRQGRHPTHGMTKTRLYREWLSMKQRCNPENTNYSRNYSRRGIVVCSEWSENFEAFRDWAMSNGYRDDLSLDRINVNGNYEPSNCRWASRSEQQNNKRNNRFITYNGKTQTPQQWSEEIGISKGTIRARLRSGWSVEKTLTEKLRSEKSKHHLQCKNLKIEL